MGEQPVVVIVDTNIFLHFRELREFDWESLLGTPNPEIVIAGQVVRELDYLKDHGSSHAIRDRARRTLQWLERQDDSQGPAPTVDLFSPPAHLFDGELDPQVDDDRILATAMQYKHDFARTVFVLTDDVGPRLKAVKLGLGVRSPPANLRHPPAPDPEAKELRELRKEVDRLRSVRPQLVLTFENGEGSAEAQILPQLELPPAPSWTVLAAKHKLQVPESSVHAYSQAIVAAVNFLQPSPEQAREHNQKVDDFRDKYEGACRERERVVRDLQNLFFFTVHLENKGGMPAKGIDASLWIAESSSECFEVVHALPSLPRLPIPPIFQPPSLLGMPGAPRISAMGNHALGHSTDPNVADLLPFFEWESTDSDDIGFGIRIPRPPSPRYVRYLPDSIGFGHQKLKHGSLLRFGPFVVRRRRADAAGCKLEFTISADNQIESSDGRLNLKLPRGHG